MRNKATRKVKIEIDRKEKNRAPYTMGKSRVVTFRIDCSTLGVSSSTLTAIGLSANDALYLCAIHRVSIQSRPLSCHSSLSMTHLLDVNL